AFGREADLDRLGLAGRQRHEPSVIHDRLQTEEIGVEGPKLGDRAGPDSRDDAFHDHGSAFPRRRFPQEYVTRRARSTLATRPPPGAWSNRIWGADFRGDAGRGAAPRGGRRKKRKEKDHERGEPEPRD